MGQHTREPLPRLHLALVHLLMNDLTQVIHHLLHRPLAAGQSLGVEPERPVAVADGFTHQVGTLTKRALVADKEKKEENKENRKAHPQPLPKGWEIKQAERGG